MAADPKKAAAALKVMAQGKTPPATKQALSQSISAARPTPKR